MHSRQFQCSGAQCRAQLGIPEAFVAAAAVSGCTGGRHCIVLSRILYVLCTFYCIVWSCILHTMYCSLYSIVSYTIHCILFTVQYIYISSQAQAGAGLQASKLGSTSSVSSGGRAKCTLPSPPLGFSSSGDFRQYFLFLSFHFFSA